MDAQPAPDRAAVTAEDARTQRQHAMLDELASLGMNFARRLDKQAARAEHTSGHAPEPAPQPALEPAPEPAPEQPAPAAIEAATLPKLARLYNETARTVRRCIMLDRILDQPVQPRADANPDRALARRKIIRKVEDSIQNQTSGKQAETLHAELCERLDSLDLDEDLRTNPLQDVIDNLRHDLGLATTGLWRPYKRRTPAEVAILHTRANAPRGSATNPTLAIPWPDHPSDAGPTMQFADDLITMLKPTRFREK